MIFAITSLTELARDIGLKRANENHENVLSAAREALVQVMMMGAYCLFFMFVIAHNQYHYQTSADNCALVAGKVTHQ